MAFWLKTSIWAFPVILFVFVCILTALRLSGTSVGIYHDTLYGDNQQDPNLLYGEPRPIRSDEWLSTTQIIASQELNGLPRFNEDLGTGRDVSLQPEVPYLDWTTVFRPHTWSHILLPLEFAFAFRWWFITYMVIVSCYLFTLYILPNKRTMAILISLAFGLSPFIHWWYQTAVSGTLAFGFMILLLAMKVIDDKKIFKNKRCLDSTLNVAGLVFFMVAFGFILYPPFLIPVAIVILFFILGYLLNKKINESADWAYILRKIGLLAFSAAIAALIGLIFIITRQDVINSITSTVYPGERIITSGGANILRMFDGFLMPFLQIDTRGPHYMVNQSESSNFILLAPFLLLPSFAILAYQFKRRLKIDYLFLCVQLVLLFFIFRTYLPFGDSLYNLLLLDRVPHSRILIGLGLAGIIQLVLFIKNYSSIALSSTKKWLFSVFYSALSLAILAVVANHVAENYPSFTIINKHVVIFAVLFASILFLLLAKMYRFALLIFIVLSLGSVFRINPVYRGLGFVSDNEVADKIRSVSESDDTWVTVDSLYFDSVGVLADRQSLTGVQVYPDVEFWSAGGKQYNKLFNRQGHLVFSSSTPTEDPFYLVAQNYLQVKFQCSKFVIKNIDYAVSVTPLQLPCTHEVGKVYYPEQSFYLYKVAEAT